MSIVKNRSTDKDWNEAYALATVLHPLSEIVYLSEKAKADIARVYNDQTLVAYSGGKDSLVLRALVDEVIDKPKYINCALENEFPSFEKWLYTTAPKDMIIVKCHAYPLEWINHHLDYLFPVEAKQQGAYVQEWSKPTYKYMKQYGYDRMIIGRRIADSNFCGQRDEHGLRSTYRASIGIRAYSPIAEWSHTQLLAFIQYFGIRLPEIYSWPNGFRFGTHRWVERRRLNGKYCDTFDEIMRLEPEVIISSRNVLDVADMYLNGMLTF